MNASKSFGQDAVRAVFQRAGAENRTVGDIAEALHVSQADRPRLRRLLAGMVDQGLLARPGRGVYALSAAAAAPATPPPPAPRTTSRTAPKPVPRATARTAPKATARTAPRATARTAPRPAPRTAPEATSRTAPEATSRTAPEATSRTAPEAAPSAIPDAVPEVAPKTTPKTTPKATPKATAGAVADPAPRRPAGRLPGRADEATDPGRTGRITVHPAGYGFVEVEDGSDAIFVPAKYRGNALDGDRVVLSLWQGYKGREGRVTEVLSRGRAKLTGTLRHARRALYLEPDDPRIATDYGHVPLVEGLARGKAGEAAVVEICHYPTPERPALIGRLLRVLGPPDDPRTEIEKILTCGDIPTEFPEAALLQADDTPQELRPEDLADRIDLRDRPFATIDPETARDFDDALCIETGPHGGPRVWIAVADVSHYVHADDPLDREAVLRGVSVYLPDRVVPMLPFPLSAGICSLKPEVDRCAMVVRLDMTPTGHIVSQDLAAAVIRSHARLDYPGVAAALSGDFRGRREQYRQWAPALGQLDALARAMRQRRMARGALDLELPEAKVILDQDDPRLIRDVVRSKGAEDVKQAYQLVEEFMIAANEAVGSFFRERGLCTVWRIHAPPEQERLHELARVLQTFGVAITDEMLAAATKPLGMRRITEVMSKTVDDPQLVRSLTFLVLRSLKQAAYDIQGVGHFGLASSDYVHFTSPIRRYADLLVHRLLKHHLHREGRASGGGTGIPWIESERLAELAATTSEHERRAMEAEREAVSMYRAYLVRDQVGETFTGRVSAVTPFGAFVELDDPFVEGLIKLDALGDDTFGYDAQGLRLRGRRSGVTLRLGDTVLVEIVDVSVTRRRIDLRLLSVAGRKVPSGKAAAGGQPERGRAAGGKAERGKAAGARAAAGGKAERGKAGRARAAGGKERRRRGDRDERPARAHAGKGGARRGKHRKR